MIALTRIDTPLEPRWRLRLPDHHQITLTRTELAQLRSTITDTIGRNGHKKENQHE